MYLEDYSISIEASLYFQTLFALSLLQTSAMGTGQCWQNGFKKLIVVQILHGENWETQVHLYPCNNGELQHIKTVAYVLCM